LAKTVVTRWWWVRHAKVINPENRIYGQRDLDCDTSDTATFAAVSRRLPRRAVWIVSALRRTHQTAAALNGAGAKLVEPDFNEQHLGQWQGRTYAEIDADGGARLHPTWIAPADVAPPGGESFAAVQSRVAAAITRLTPQLRGRDVVVVAHGGTIRAALAMALDLDPARALAFSVDHVSLTRIDHIDEQGAAAWRLAYVNRLPTG
jgi:broad specificity phosphatase PhoE